MNFLSSSKLSLACHAMESDLYWRYSAGDRRWREGSGEREREIEERRAWSCLDHDHPSINKCHLIHSK